MSMKESKLMDKSNKKIGIILIILSSLVTSIGQGVWKIANGQNIFYLLLGMILYIIGAILMIIALKFGRLSNLHPLLSVGYVFSIFIGYFFIGEKISVHMIIGIAMIIFGVLLIGGDNE
jgi:uncharacterized membrane protein